MSYTRILLPLAVVAIFDGTKFISHALMFKKLHVTRSGDVIRNSRSDGRVVAKIIDLEIWLSKERDECESKTSASVSKVQSAFGRVQRFNPGVKKKPRQRPEPKPKRDV